MMEGLWKLDPEKREIAWSDLTKFGIHVIE